MKLIFAIFKAIIMLAVTIGETIRYLF